jgi:ATP-dependent Lon protease
MSGDFMKFKKLPESVKSKILDLEVSRFLRGTAEFHQVDGYSISIVKFRLSKSQFPDSLYLYNACVSEGFPNEELQNSLPWELGEDISKTHPNLSYRSPNALWKFISGIPVTDNIGEGYCGELAQVALTKSSELTEDEENARMQDENMNELKELSLRIQNSKMGREQKEKVKKEYRKLTMLAPQTSESALQRVYLDTVLSLPWNEYAVETNDLIRSEEVLNSSHYGLKAVKERVLEYLAVNQFTGTTSNGTMLCLYGPPGVGKTSIAQSIADATGRELVTVALGGVSDEADIRGHRKTYIGSMPGRIMAAIKKANKMNPIILLDEIDKMGATNKGDPAAALLEVLDPSQNKKFVDHYLEMEFDLSKVMFIATANSLNTISSPLRDRMEIVTLTGYTDQEKVEIGRKHLAVSVLKKSGLLNRGIKFSVESIEEIIKHYTKEAGVRNLEKEMSKVCRKIVKSALDGKKELVSGISRMSFKGAEKDNERNITPAIVNKLLGVRKFEDELKNKKNEVGVAQGLAYTSVGGCLLFVEVAITKGKGGFKTTGQLGDVMKESSQIALTYIQTRSEMLGISDEFFEKHNIHIHFPDGNTPKDGPSAGIALTLAITSAITGIPYNRNVAGTGEVDLRGNALPIGGVKEKMIGAYVAGVSQVFIPRTNIKDLYEVSDEIKGKIEILPISCAEEALLIALDFNTPKALEVKQKISDFLFLNGVSAVTVKHSLESHPSLSSK